jgi:hypothetical protein
MMGPASVFQILFCAGTILFLAQAADAQVRSASEAAPVEVGLRGGIAAGGLHEQPACGPTTYAVLGIFLSKGQPWFGRASLDWTLEAPPRSCDRFHPVFVMRDGEQVEQRDPPDRTLSSGVPRLSAGIGRRLHGGSAAPELQVAVGLSHLSGDDGRSWSPWLGGSVSVGLGGAFSVGLQHGWNRLPHRREYYRAFEARPLAVEATVYWLKLTEVTVQYRP